MWPLLKIELLKIFRRSRTYIAFGAVAAIVCLIQLALQYDGRSYVDFLLGNLAGSFEISDSFKSKLLNGYMVCFVILNTLLIHLPLLIALIAADAIAGEANMGTLRLAMTKPVSRTQFMIIKFTASFVYTVLLLLWMAILALFGSMLLFGTNDLVVLRSTGIEQIASFDVLWRYAAALGYATVSLTVVASLAIFLSVFADNAIGPIIATISIIIVFTILSELNIPMYDRTIKPYLFTTHMVAWKGFFYVKATPEGTTINGSIENLDAVMKSLGILLLYIGLFFTSAIWVFRKKDILS